MSDLVFLLRWLLAERGGLTVQHCDDAFGSRWEAFAWCDIRSSSTGESEGSTPLRALRNLGHDLQELMESEPSARKLRVVNQEEEV